MFVLISQGHVKDVYCLYPPPGPLQNVVLFTIGQGHSKRMSGVLPPPGPYETCVAVFPVFVRVQIGMLILIGQGHVKVTLFGFYTTRANRTTFPQTMFSFYEFPVLFLFYETSFTKL